MVETTIEYIGQYLKTNIGFLDVVNAPVKRLTNGVIYKNTDSEKQNVSISDEVGHGVYIRQTAPETTSELAAKTSMGNEYKISARCRLVFYSFKNEYSEEKIKSILQTNLAGVRFPRYIGTSKFFKISINSISTEFEKIFQEERGGNYDGSKWPTIIAIDFTLTYEDKNCDVCDLSNELNCFELPPSQEFPNSSNTPGKIFCDRVAACSVIIELQETAASLQEQIDNLPSGGLTCDNLSECQSIVDILASINGIISSLPSSYFTCGSLAGCQTIIDIMAAIDELEAGLASTNENLTTLSNDLGSLVTLVNTLQGDLDDHVVDTNNPHQTTLEQVRSEDNVINGNIDFDGNQADNVANPSSNQQISTKLYTDTAEANAKAYADSLVVAVFRPAGDWDASVGTYPTTGTGALGAIRRGDTYKISVAGNMGGYAYDIGDSIYAIIATPGQLAANWGDFEHNTQQATESERGTGQIVTAAIIANENSLDDVKIVTTKKLWLNFWQRVLALAWTWASKQTFTTAPRFSSAGASQYLKTDGSKDLTSVSTIPATDITETLNKNFVTDNQKLYNDFTSSGQTQMNSKQPTLVSATNIKTVNGNTLLGAGDLVTGFISLFLVHVGAWSPNDSTTYYFSNGVAPTTTDTQAEMNFGPACTLSMINISIGGNTTAGTNENVSLYFRNITTGVSSLIGTFTTNGSSATQNRSFSFSGLSISVATNDKFCLEARTPVYATNPVGILLRGTLSFKI